MRVSLNTYTCEYMCVYVSKCVCIKDQVKTQGLTYPLHVNPTLLVQIFAPASAHLNRLQQTSLTLLV